MMNALKTLLVGAALAASATASNAAVYYADTIVDADYGTCTDAKYCASDDRLNSDNALGATDGAFYALGLGGSLVVGFAKSLFPAGTVSTFEVTFNRLVGHDEAVQILTLDSDMNLVEDLGHVTNTTGGGSKFASLPFTYIKLVDMTKAVFPGTTSFDGFDVDSVSVAAVPLPAAGALMLAGLGGFAALRRRKNAA